jgi:hypothetical protein
LVELDDSALALKRIGWDQRVAGADNDFAKKAHHRRSVVSKGTGVASA